MGGERTKLGDNLRLRFRHRAFRCEVKDPLRETGTHSLRFFMIPSHEPPPPGKLAREALAINELFEEVQDDVEAHGLKDVTIASHYDEEAKCYCLDVIFPDRDLMTAYQYQLSFGEQGRQR